MSQEQSGSRRGHPVMIWLSERRYRALRQLARRLATTPTRLAMNATIQAIAAQAAPATLTSSEGERLLTLGTPKGETP